ncbi:MAG: hypothetical protein PHX18_08245 [Candidatus Gastranaerophilales bacterium]|nr:hypothetical protein [Candidatus Gastranaerophilales bacterium]
MQKTLKLRGHIIDSLVLSKLLDQINALGIECYATKVEVGRKREDISSADFVIETDDEAKMKEALELATKQGATEN